MGRVGDVDVLRERVRVYFEDHPPKVFPAAEVTLLNPPSSPPERGPGDGTPPDGAPRG